jgi:hypothetical protein
MQDRGLSTALLSGTYHLHKNFFSIAKSTYVFLKGNRFLKIEVFGVWLLICISLVTIVILNFILFYYLFNFLQNWGLNPGPYIARCAIYLLFCFIYFLR